jgi:hypothetical protein
MDNLESVLDLGWHMVCAEYEFNNIIGIVKLIDCALL